MSEIKKAQNQSKFKAAFQKGKKKQELSNLIYTSKPYKQVFASSYNVAKL